MVDDVYRMQGNGEGGEGREGREEERVRDLLVQLTREPKSCSIDSIHITFITHFPILHIDR